MLILATEPQKCERCGKLYKRGTVQDMSRHCVNCGNSVHYCDECVKFGCPKCGGKLVDVWTYHKEVLGTPILF